MHTVALPDGTSVPTLGQGTWNIGDTRSRRDAEIAALRRGVELGMTLIDTAEMYGNGASERLVAAALVTTAARPGLFLVSKALPRHATPAALRRACEASLKRLGTDYLDLYLLHWRGATPLAETVAGMQRLRTDGLIRHWGVSNFDVDDLADLAAAGGQDCATNQILYNLGRRAPEYALMPAMTAANTTCMAYSPIEQGRLPQTGAIATVARRHDATPMQIAIAWILRQAPGAPGLIAIPKASTVAHVEQNRAAADLRLTAEDCAALDRQFRPPTHRQALEMI